jgi:predicted nuclease with RNAse H fold
MATVLGIDLAASERKASGVCILRGKRVQTSLVRTDDEIVALAQTIRPQLTSIHQRTATHLRPCDRELLRRGIRFFPVTLGAMRQLTERGIRLRHRLEGLGFRVVEAFPGGAQDVLGLPRKQHDLKGLRDGLRRLGLQGICDDATHDELDAITAAYVGWLFLRGRAALLGDDHSGIVMPLPQKACYPVKL